jgi:hypothetical protein
VISLLVAEGIVRLLFGGRIVLFPRFHDKASYGKYTIRRLRPNTTFWHHSVDGSWKFVTNSKGFRSDTEYSYDKPNGVLRVLCLGDSNTQGFECHLGGLVKTRTLILLPLIQYGNGENARY